MIPTIHNTPTIIQLTTSSPLYFLCAWHSCFSSFSIFKVSNIPTIAFAKDAIEISTSTAITPFISLLPDSEHCLSSYLARELTITKINVSIENTSDTSETIIFDGFFCFLPFFMCFHPLSFIRLSFKYFFSCNNHLFLLYFRYWFSSDPIMQKGIYDI